MTLNPTFDWLKLVLMGFLLGRALITRIFLGRLIAHPFRTVLTYHDYNELTWNYIQTKADTVHKSVEPGH